MKPWAELPVAAQVRRIRGALGGLLPRWGLGSAELRFIYHGENTTFRAVTPRGSFLVRVHRLGYNSPEQTASELMWLEALDGLGPKPVRTQDGELIARVDAPGVAASHLCVFRWVEGSIVGHRVALETVAQIGELMARLHEHAAAWKPPCGFTRHTWKRMSMFSEEAAPKRLWDKLPVEHRRDFTRIKRDAVRVCERLPVGLLHADLHSMNVLRTTRGVAAIDFDDCGIAPWVYDVAVVAGMWRKAHHERYAALMEGYHRVREFPAGQLQHLPLITAARQAGVCLWVTARAEEHAVYRAKLREFHDELLRRARASLERVYA